MNDLNDIKTTISKKTLYSKDMATTDELLKLHEKYTQENTCGLKHTTRAVYGHGNPTSQVVFIGEAPGKKEEATGVPFVGAAGKFLDEMLASIGMERASIYITNIVKYRPPNNRDPSPAEKDACQDWLHAELNLISPKLIVFLGRHSMNHFFPNLKISEAHGVLLKEKRLIDNGLKFRNIDLHNFDEELKKLYPFVNAAFKNNFLFSPIIMPAFIEKYKKILDFVNPEFVLIAEDEKENIIGFIFCYEDLLNKKEKSLVIKTLARDQSKKWSGLGAVMANRIIHLAKERGYRSVIHAFMMDEGRSSETSRKFFGNIYKEYVLYGLKL